MSVALLLIATGERYRKSAEKFINSAAEHFIPHDIILWTDGFIRHELIKDNPPITHLFRKEALGTPYETLNRYTTFLGAREILEKYDYLFYSDVDMLFTNDVEPEDILGKGLTGCLHPRFIGREGIPERDPKSTACIPEGSNSRYFVGGFQGGESGAFIQAMEVMSGNIETDNQNGIVAVWHDESHWNKYLFDNPPAIALQPPFIGFQGHLIHPETKIVALNKLLADLGCRKLPALGRYMWVRKKKLGNLPLERPIRMREETAQFYIRMGVIEQVTEPFSHNEVPEMTKLAIAIKSCHKDLDAGFHKAIRETWGKEAQALGVDVFFFMGKDPTQQDTKSIRRYERGEVVLDVDDSYDELPRKTRGICRWMTGKMFHHVFLCDNDTYVRPKALVQIGYEYYDYAGDFFRNHPGQAPFRYTDERGIPHENCRSWASGGYGYFLSRRAAEIIVEKTPMFWAEDMYVGDALAQAIDSHLIKAVSIPLKTGGNNSSTEHFPKGPNRQYTPELLRLAYVHGGFNVLFHKGLLTP